MESLESRVLMSAVGMTGCDAPVDPAASINDPQPVIVAAAEPMGSGEQSAAAPSSPEGMRIGMNVEPAYDWSAAWTFTDVFKHSREWISHDYNATTEAFTWHGTAEVATDEHGWVTGLSSWTNEQGHAMQQQIGTLMLHELDGNYPGGIYRAEWDGEGTVVWDGNMQVVEEGVTGEGRNYVLLDVTPDNFGIHMVITDINPDNPISGVNVWMPDYNGESFAGQRNWTLDSHFSPFHPLFIERLQSFDTLRFMQFGSTTDSDVVTWDQRRQLTDARQHEGIFRNGSAPEYMIAMANEIGADAWFTTPHMADDNYVREFAEMVFEHLGEDQTAYIEWGNEIWNGAPGFGVNHWINDQLALEENSGMTFNELAAREIRRDFGIWSEVFEGHEDRLVRVVGAFTAAPSFVEDLLSHMNGEFDALSPGAYIAPDPEERELLDGNTNGDDVMDLTINSVATTLGMIQAHGDLVEQYEAELGRDLQLVIYEGGTHLDGQDQSFQNAFFEAESSPRMYEAFDLLVNGMNDLGVDAYLNYQYTQRLRNLRWGNFGALHYQDQSIEEAHKYRALIDAVEGDLIDADNSRPIISAIADQTSDGSAVTLTFDVADAETPADALRLIVDSSESSIVVDGNFSITGESNQRQLIVTPNAGADGFTTVSVMVVDEDGGTALERFELVVNAPGGGDPGDGGGEPGANEAPVAQNVQIDLAEDEELRYDLRWIASDDTTASDDLIFDVHDATSGELVLEEGRFVIYTPALNFTGSAGFAYTVTDAEGLSATGTFDLSITSTPDVPTTEAITIDLMEDESTTFDLHWVSEDVDSPHSSLQYAITGSFGGTVELAPDGHNFTFTPAQDWNGPGGIDYTVTDPDGQTAWGSVDFNILPVNDEPIVEATTLEMYEDVPFDFDLHWISWDVESSQDALVYDVSGAYGGAITLNADGHSFVFTPIEHWTGAAGFDYTVTDPDGGVTRSEVNINILPVNDAPVAADVNEDTLQDTPLTIDLRSFTGDIETAVELLTYEVHPAHGGTATLLEDGHTAQFTPDSGYSGDAGFWYAVRDADGEDAWAYVSVQVMPVAAEPENTAPVAFDGYFETSVAMPVEIDLREHGFDDETPSEGLQFEVLEDSAGGGLNELLADGYTLRFVPDSDFAGFTNIGYRVIDEQGADAWAGIGINVINEVPQVSEAVFETTSGQPLEIDLHDLVSDRESADENLTFQVFDTDGGTVELLADGHTLRYTPWPDFIGSPRIAFGIFDEHGEDAWGAIDVHVQAPSALAGLLAQIDEEGIDCLTLEEVSF